MAEPKSETLFGRKIGLVVFNPPTAAQSSTANPATGTTTTVKPGVGQATPGSGLDLSEMRIVFKVNQSDIETPGTAFIRVYNLSDDTVRKVRGEFQKVTLQAGYENGPYGVIFSGDIKQIMTGHESPVDSYLDIFAADGDTAYVNSVINTSLAAGSTPADQFGALSKAMDLQAGYVTDLPVTALSRGKVMFGMARDYMRRLGETTRQSWSIQNGQLVMVPQAGYRAGEAVVLTAATGLIGYPQQTPGGIQATALLNPKIQIGGLVQIDNRSINQGLSTAPPTTPGRLESIPGFNAKIADDGLYKVLVHEAVGDSRGAPWYSTLTCLAVDRSAPDGGKVKPYWAGGPT
ncbi:phage protein [Azospirillum argentinense]